MSKVVIVEDLVTPLVVAVIVVKINIITEAVVEKNIAGSSSCRQSCGSRRSNRISDSTKIDRCGISNTNESDSSGGQNSNSKVALLSIVVKA